VTITAQHFVSEIVDGTAVIAEVWGGDAQHCVPIDSIVLNMQRFPRRSLFDELEQRFEGEIHRIGDSLAPRRVDEAIYEGEKTGRAI